MKRSLYSKEVTLTLFGNMISINPWIPNLADTLTCRRQYQENVDRRLEPDAPPIRIGYHLEELFTVQDTGGAITFGGLRARIERFFKLWNIEYKVEDKRDPIPKADTSALRGEEFRNGQAEVLATIASSRYGVVEAPPAFGKTHVIELVCKMYPDLNILVTTEKGAVLKSIYDRIRSRLPSRRVCLVAGGKKIDPDAQIYVCSSKSLHKMDGDWPDLVLCDEVHCAAAHTISMNMCRFLGARRFGLSASPEGRSDKAELVIEALFGPVSLKVSYASAVTTGNVVPLRVLMLPSDIPNLSKYKLPITKERWGIWRNYQRNNMIADVVEMLKGEQVLILVRVVEHALCLKKHLPEFELVHKGISKDKLESFKSAGIYQDGDPTSVDIEDIQARFASGECRGVIATMVWREGVDFPNLKYVIRADGLGGNIPAIQIGGRASRIANGKTQGVIIDFDDSSGFKTRTAKRKTSYRKQKWRITDVPSMDELAHEIQDS